MRLSRMASAILKLKLPKKVRSKGGNAFGPIRSQARLNALKKYAVPRGGVLNPYGKFGNCRRSRYRLGDLDHLALRPEVMKRNRRRKRIKLEENKRVALEMHELQQMARENAVAAMSTLIEISQNKREPAPSRIAASAVILDRGYGKASQVTMSANLTNGKTQELTGDELERRIGKALKRVNDITGGVREAPASEKGPDHLRKLN